jgi:hypothetical protein
MDHLKSAEQRKARWYCRTIWPRFLRVRHPQSREDLMTDCSQNQPQGIVYGVPMQWLAQEKLAAPPVHDDDVGNTDSHNMLLSHDFMKQCFDQHGFMVISGVLSQEDCRHSLSLAAEWHAAAASVEQEGLNAPPGADGCAATTGTSAATTGHNVPLRSVEGGILPFYGSGHSAFAWSIRAHANVHRVFAALLGSEDLLASLDGVILWDDNRIGTTRYPTTSTDDNDIGWFHIDQNPCQKPAAAGIQGLVNLIDVDESTGGNVLVLDSHRLFPDHYTTSDTRNYFYAKRLEELNGDDWMEIDPTDERVLVRNKVVSICLKAGDMLLWDSRMVHCSYPPSASVIHQQEPLTKVNGTTPPLFLRAATLVSMMSQHRVSPATLKCRKAAVHASRTLTHWVDKAAELGAERSEDSRHEEETVAFIRRQYPGVLLGWDDLTTQQQRLVSGT